LGVGFAKYRGLKVVALDTRDEALALAKECGADIILNARDANVKEKIHEATGGGAQATINLAEAAPTIPLACAITKTHGRLVQVAQVRSIFSVSKFC
jgi:propanol-preferring alcohol dehydrogenase